MANIIQSLKSQDGSVTWINIVNAQDEEINYLKRKFKFEDVDLDDARAARYAQRPKFHIRPHYCFLILQFPFYNRQEKSIVAEEIDFFIGRNYIISIHRNNLPPVRDLFSACKKSEFYREQYLGEGSSFLLYEIIIRLQQYCYPILDHMSMDIRIIEDNIFSGHERQMIREISYIKKNIFDTRKILEAHKSAMEKITRKGTAFLPPEKLKIYYHDLIDNTKEIWDILEGQRDLIESLDETNTSLVSSKLSDIMKVLTIFSVVLMPLSLITAIFTMNTVNMPVVDHPNSFWILTLAMALVAFVMFWFFKRKKWL